MGKDLGWGLGDCGMVEKNRRRGLYLMAGRREFQRFCWETLIRLVMAMPDLRGLDARNVHRGSTSHLLSLPRCINWI